MRLNTRGPEEPTANFEKEKKDPPKRGKIQFKITSPLTYRSDGLHLWEPSKAKQREREIERGVRERKKVYAGE